MRVKTITWKPRMVFGDYSLAVNSLERIGAACSNELTPLEFKTHVEWPEAGK